MKNLALDLGDRWVGSAISDPLGITCRPYQTVELEYLEIFLKETIAKEGIKTIIIGYPKTFSGTVSAQTQKIIDKKEELEKTFASLNCQWILWDERLSSKRADALKKATSTEEKRKSHSIAAAFILQSYLDSKS